MNPGRALAALFALGAWSGCMPSLPEARPAPVRPSAPSKQAGKGYYLTKAPPGAALPSDARGKPARPKITRDFVGPVKTNSWWSSLIWQYDPQNPHSENMYPHPLALRAGPAGLGLSYPTDPEITEKVYLFSYDEDLVAGLAGLSAKATRVAGYSDFAVTASFRDEERELRATFGHGLPYVYFTRRGSAPFVVRVAKSKEKTLEIWKHDKNVLGLSVAGHHYGLFAPAGSSWQVGGRELRSDLGGKDYCSIAVLPGDSEETFELFRRHAYAFVTGTRVSWRYDAKAAKVTTEFELETEARETGGDLATVPLVALQRHQWLHTADELLDLGYVSPRGAMKLLRGRAFTTELSWHGVLPILPNAALEGHGRLEFLVTQHYAAGELFPPGHGEKPARDSYWIGKSLGKHASVLMIADQLGDDSARDHLLLAIKNELEDWFDGHAPSLFYYDKTWRTLIGFPEAYMSSAQLNDHHFHYGYFVMAAAVVAHYDPEWAKAWGPFVELLIRDAANWDRSDARFPFLRHMDPYAGHSWANGPALFKEGNNEEASSEDLNFSTAVILWGAVTGNEEIRDLGIYLYATQVSAVREYWFDVDQAVFPKRFKHDTLGMVWGGGGWYNTWFDEDPNVIHGINFLPFSGGSLYHGRWPDYVRKNYRTLEAENRGEIWTWRDYILMYLALADPKRAVELYERDPHLTLEFGNSRPLLHHWLYNLRELGRFDPRVTADAATYAVFHDGRLRSYAAFNPSGEMRSVRFSDGFELVVKPRAFALKRAVALSNPESGRERTSSKVEEH